MSDQEMEEIKESVTVDIAVMESKESAEEKKLIVQIALPENINWDCSVRNIGGPFVPHPITMLSKGAKGGQQWCVLSAKVRKDERLNMILDVPAPGDAKFVLFEKEVKIP